MHLRTRSGHSPADVPAPHQADRASAKELKFGDWQDGSPWLRIGQPRPAGATAQGKRYAVDRSLFNNFDDTHLGQRPEANLKVYGGGDLTEGDFEENLSNLPSLAWIAAQRMATVTVHFTIPGNRLKARSVSKWSTRTEKTLLTRAT
ncbi:hypothetical protein [Streptomyces sp. NBC_00145]|uniref:hypothetical protein n=1 Tax=Streptomyces sp. NBC_00145 TaxID=2975666 RepID=UPI002E1708DA